METVPLETTDFRVRLRTPHMLKPWDPDNPAPHFKQYIDFSVISFHNHERLLLTMKSSIAIKA